MARLLNFIREYLDIRRESQSYCRSCEVLKEQLNLANFEKKQLLDRFVLTSAPPVQLTIETPKPIAPKIVPWKIQRELLEAEDRAKAMAMRRATDEQELARANRQGSEPIESNSISVDELEKELGVQ